MTAEPRYATARDPSRKSMGPQAAKIAKALGKPLLPWQQQVFDVAKEIDPDTGHLWYDLVIVTVQRQAGKTTAISVDSTLRALTKPNARIWYTAQRGRYASEWMKEEHEPVLGASAVFRGKYRFFRANASEAIYWANGSQFKVFPPKRDALHGKQGDTVYVDEAWAFDDVTGAELKQAIRPTMITRPDPQLWVLSTMGDDLSLYLNDYVDLGRDSVGQSGGRVAYFEWSIPEDADPEDMDIIARHHPAYGHTVTMDALKAARVDFKDDVAGWGRAYGNRPTFSRVAAFPPGTWEACGTEQPALPTRCGFGFDVTPSGDRATVCAAWRDDSGAEWVEVLRDGPGNGWVAGYLLELWEKYRLPVGYDTAGVATLSVADEVARLGRGRVQLRGMTSAGFASACATLASGVVNGTLRHSRQAPLNRAVAVASRRPILDGGWAWGRKLSTGSITPLVAATVALRIFDEMPAKRSLRVLTA